MSFLLFFKKSNSVKTIIYSELQYKTVQMLIVLNNVVTKGITTLVQLEETGISMGNVSQLK